MELIALVVIYNQSCENSLTCQGLKQCSSFVRVIVYDNSTRDFGNREYCASMGWKYLGGNGNTGLSKAYNCVIDQCLRDYQDAVLCLFDDDSQISPEYFVRLTAAVTEHLDASIFAPILLTENARVLSPYLLNPKTGAARLFNDTEEMYSYTGDQLSALNSGLAIRLSIFRNYRYDESLFLDCVDDKFIMDMRAENRTIQVFPYRCVHLLSAFAKSSKESALHRFSIFVKDVKCCYKTNPYAYRRLLFRRTLRLTLEYKSLSFIADLWKTR